MSSVVKYQLKSKIVLDNINSLNDIMVLSLLDVKTNKEYTIQKTLIETYNHFYEGNSNMIAFVRQLIQLANPLHDLNSSTIEISKNIKDVINRNANEFIELYDVIYTY